MERLKGIFSIFHFFSWCFFFLLIYWVFWSEGFSNAFFISLVLLLIFIILLYSHFCILTRYLGSGKNDNRPGI